MNLVRLSGTLGKGMFLLLSIFLIAASAYSESRIVTFDVPAAGNGPGQGTFALGINDLREVVGYFADTKGVYHGFVRSAEGAISVIDAPGAGASPGSGQGTIAISIDIERKITGQFQDSASLYHAFLRERDGRVIALEAPGAGTAANQGTTAENINSAREVAGFFLDSNSVSHGFSRSREGVFTSFEARAAAGTGAPEGTVTSLGSGLNIEGAITGSYLDANGQIHGYLRHRDGVIKSFDPPGSVATYPGGVNVEGIVVGGASDANGILHGFVRSPKGDFTVFDVPGAGNSPGLPPESQGTVAFAITPFGRIAGFWVDSKMISHGFVRHPNGEITKFDAPGAGTVPITSQGTYPQGMNDQGEITGYLQDSQDVAHGFIRF